MEQIDGNSPCERDHAGSRDRSATDLNRSGTDRSRSETDRTGGPRGDLSSATDSPCEGDHARAPCRSVADRTDGLRRDLSCSTVGPDASVPTPTSVDERDEMRLGKTGDSDASRDPTTASDGGVAFRTRSHGPPGRSVDGPRDSALDRMALVSGGRVPPQWSSRTAGTVRGGPQTVRDGPPALDSVAFVGSTQWSTGTAGSVRDGPPSVCGGPPPVRDGLTTPTLESTAMVQACREPYQWSTGIAGTVRGGPAGSVQDRPAMSAFNINTTAPILSETAQLTCAINQLVAQLSANRPVADRVECTTDESRRRYMVNSVRGLPVHSVLSSATTSATAGQCASSVVDCRVQRDYGVVNERSPELSPGGHCLREPICKSTKNAREVYDDIVRGLRPLGKSASESALTLTAISRPQSNPVHGAAHLVQPEYRVGHKKPSPYIILFKMLLHLFIWTNDTPYKLLVCSANIDAKT